MTSATEQIESLVDRLSRWKIMLVELGSFLIFAATYGVYVAKEIWHAISPFFH